MEKDLYSPSLSGEHIKNTKSYNLTSLFVVAILGQIVAIAAIGLQNAIWLKVEKKVLYILIGICTALFIGKIYLIYAFTHQMIDVERSTYRGFGSLLAIGCFIAFYNLLKDPYNLHISTKDSTESLVLPGIIWCIIGVGIELLLVVTISRI